MEKPNIVVEKTDKKIPKITASGDLTIDNSKDVVIKTKKELEMVDNKQKKEIKKTTKKDIPLPNMYDVFMHKGHEYKVIYINDGQHRFTCEPYKGDY